ncbi:MAG: hypothetical protein DRI97_03165 [Bacteroidetes bacterium]|nr:MAG: hypothetical protein DRI97_03165 [Bacteroidota bacterium]RLD82108.1 MAG: hypothetical protein DRJ15_02525 [Bacteroidota bacterium]
MSKKAKGREIFYLLVYGVNNGKSELKFEVSYSLELNNLCHFRHFKMPIMMIKEQNCTRLKYQ